MGPQALPRIGDSVGLFDFLKRRSQPPPATDLDPLLTQVADAFPKGPARRGMLRDDARGSDRAVIGEILTFDAEDHWLLLFLGCRAVGAPFELTLRAAKVDAEPPSTWCIEPVTRVANAIGGGALCAPGVTWKLGPIGAPESAFAGLVTLPDLQFGELAPARLLQLVPITQAELGMRGADLERLCTTIEQDRARMTGRA